MFTTNNNCKNTSFFPSKNTRVHVFVQKAEQEQLLNSSDYSNCKWPKTLYTLPFRWSNFFATVVNKWTLSNRFPKLSLSASGQTLYSCKNITAANCPVTCHLINIEADDFILPDWNTYFYSAWPESSVSTRSLEVWAYSRHHASQSESKTVQTQDLHFI